MGVHWTPFVYGPVAAGVEGNISALQSAVTALQTAKTLGDKLHQERVALGVVPNAIATFAGIFDGFTGTITYAKYRAAVAATSVAGDVTIAVYDANDDSVIVAPVSIDGLTTLDLTLVTPGYVGGAYAKITSDNADAVAGIGMALILRSTVTAAT